MTRFRITQRLAATALAWLSTAGLAQTPAPLNPAAPGPLQRDEIVVVGTAATRLVAAVESAGLLAAVGRATRSRGESAATALAAGAGERRCVSVALGPSVDEVAGADRGRLRPARFADVDDATAGDVPLERPRGFLLDLRPRGGGDGSQFAVQVVHCG